MVDNIDDFEYFITASERDALALESNLIKKYQPHYNILLKDGKAFPYIAINMNEPFPKLQILRKVGKKGYKYFGPYFAGLNAGEIVKTSRMYAMSVSPLTKNILNQLSPALMTQLESCKPVRTMEMQSENLERAANRKNGKTDKKIEENKKNPVIFLDMPLLYEVKYDSYVDETWLVYVDPVTQLTRLMKRNGYSESEALARIHAQLPIDKKRSLAQVIIDNTGSPEETQKQVLVAWQALMDRIKG